MPLLNKDKSHPVYGKTLFQACFRIFSYTKSPSGWDLYCRSLEANWICHMGRVVEGSVLPAKEFYDWAARSYSQEMYRRIKKRWELENRSQIRYTDSMRYNEKPERNKKIKKMYEQGLSYMEIAKHFGLKSKSTVHEIINRKRRKSELSTPKREKVLAKVRRPVYTSNS